ncbi:MAG TPA: GatB/YqeY domain-containing protein [Clostridiaceae bacterium]
MSMKETLALDWKNALKAKEKLKATTISMVRAAILQVEKSGSATLNDEDIIVILAKEIKQRRESIVEFEKGNRQDLIDKTSEEIEILLNYLPQQLNENEILVYVKDAAVEVGANSIKDMGKLMSAVIAKTKGRADGKIVSKLVKEYLSK